MAGIHAQSGRALDMSPHAAVGSYAGFDAPNGPLDAPTQSFNTAQAGAYINRGGASWNVTDGQPLEITYAFRKTEGNMNDPGFSKFSALQIQMTELTLSSWADVAQITFNRVGSGTSGPQAYSDDATMLFGNFFEPDGAGAAHASLPNPSATGSFLAAGDVCVNVAYDYEATPVLWEYGVMTLTHEIGHALGLEHPGDYNASDGTPITYADDAEYIQDTRQYTVMSYFSETNTGADFEHHYSVGPLMHDISAMQRLYGANMETRTGSDTYGFNNSTGQLWYQADSNDDPLIFCVWDAGGKGDTLDFSGYAHKQNITLAAEQFSDVGGMVGNISIYKGVVIENAIGGSGADDITGNASANTLRGNGGADKILGGKGADIILGGTGRDVLRGDAGDDKFVFEALADSVKSVRLADTILDLTDLDRIVLTAIDANSTRAGNNAFTLGGDSFDNVKGELIVWYHEGRGATMIQGDVNGDGVADFTIRVIGDHSDFTNFAL